jgi:arylsulfatase A-like enzyme
MRVARWAAASSALIVVLLGAVWVFREDLALFTTRLRQPPIEANRPVVWASGPETPTAPADKRAPNIVFILADDLGFNDITVNGGGVAGGAVPTPNIDSIARDGVTFTNGYAGNATCAPSRAAIMTGRYPTRFGFEFTPAPVGFSRLIASFNSPGVLHHAQFIQDNARDLPDLDHEAVPHSEITIARLLQGQGYHTMHLGKWHLGGAPGTRPEDQGFDESLGFIPGASLYLPENDSGVENSKQSFDPIDKFLWAALPYMVQFNGGPRFHPNAYMTDYLTDQAVAGIHANRNRPFFLYLAYNAVHTPLQATKADFDALSAIKDHRLRVYAAMVRNLDRNVGRVLATLKAEGLDKNTLVIFTSDNGGANYIGLPDINRPYRGWKASFFEGGVHVPFFMRWPAKLPAHAVYTSPVGHIDIFATTAGVAGAPLPKDRVIDGVNLLPFLTGAAAGAPHDHLYWRSGHYSMIIQAGWKLQRLEDPHRLWLYNLAADPTEHRNLAAANPAKVAQLTALLQRQDSQMVKPIWPSVLRGEIAVDHPLGVPDKPGDDYVIWDN